MLLGSDPSTTRGLGAAQGSPAPPHRIGVPTHGASCRTWRCLPWPTATTPQSRTAGQICVGLDVQHHQARSIASVGIAGDVRTCIPATPNSSSVRAHHDAPGPHVR